MTHHSIFWIAFVITATIVGGIIWFLRETFIEIDHFDMSPESEAL